MYLVLSYALAALSIAAAVVCVFAEWSERKMLRVVSKVVASTAFVAFAVACGAVATAYGRLILLALVLSWLGDIMLLSLRKMFLICGIMAFLLAHAAFAAAFLTQTLAVTWLAATFVFLIAVGAGLFRWFWPHLESPFRGAVAAYLLAIMSMTSLAFAVAAASASPIVAVGAAAFTASDVSVARDRFVSREIVNRIWGLPLYYAAQVMLASTVLWYR